MPSAIVGSAGDTLSAISGMSREMMKEIEDSYAILFHCGSLESQPECRVFSTILLGSEKVCLCRRCSFNRFEKEITDELEASPRPDEEDKGKEGSPPKTAVIRDPKLKELISRNKQSDGQSNGHSDKQPKRLPVMWDRAQFPYLLPRIVALEILRNETAPWNLKSLFTNTRKRSEHWAA